MKLKIKEFSEFVKDYSVNNPERICNLIELGEDAYYDAVNSQTDIKVGYEVVKNIINYYGEEILLKIIDLEEETIDGIRAKFVRIGRLLY